MPDTTPAALDLAVAEAATAAPLLARMLPSQRADLLRAVADRLDAAGPDLVPVAERESHLPTARLRGELARTTFQLRLFADALLEGSFLEATLDAADPDHPLGPRPDLRRVLVPLGPVAVYAASNFPFAFSVAGGDTASALAAGCPVVLKAHPGHPDLSDRTGALVADALSDAGAPAGSFGVVHGLQTGIDLIQDPRIQAGAFTGSVPAGRALFDLAARRPAPVPFYGELGSLNPAVVTRAAVEARGAEIAAGFVGSFTLGAGQFCTKPALLFLPAGHGLWQHLSDALDKTAAALLLSDGIATRHAQVQAELIDTAGVRVVREGTLDGGSASPTLLAVDAASLRADPERLLTECFGPTAMIVEYADATELAELLALLEGNLTATVHAEPSDVPALGPLTDLLAAKAGRLVFNGWPTGVAVAWAMQHGGPYPATTAPHTSVGVTAVRRFLRPVCFQGFPESLLPQAVRDGNPLRIVRRKDGVLGPV